MKHRNLIIHLAGTICLCLFSCKPSAPPTDLSKANMIPRPVSITATGSAFQLKANTGIYVDEDTELKNVAQYLANRLKPATGFNLQVFSTTSAPAPGNIYLTISPDPQLGEEGYELTITEDQLKLSAPTPAGLFRGIQTIRQILPAGIESTSVQPGPWRISTGTIRDYPTYSWRGSMLDVARHFFSVEDVKLYIDLIAFYKINILHLHLSDDQGWRIEIKSWPNLTLHGGSTQVGGAKGGFYTQEQYEDIIAYASSRYITIVPEIDLPGHINSALASYGELNGGTIVPEEGRVSIPTQSQQVLGRKTKPTELYTGIQVGWSTLRAEKEITFKFIEDVLSEVSALTPGPYLHVGGDEAAATKKADYITFINRFTKMAKENGKIMVGWEEIAQGNINSEVITQYWHSSKYALMAVEKQSKIIMSPANKTYLDMSYDSTSKLGLHWAAYIEVDSAYQWSPLTLVKGISQENILGIEAPLWSETISTMDDIEYLTFPRLPGYAEIGWSPENGRGWEEYKVRLASHGPRLKAMEVNFYKSPRVPWVE